MANSKDIKVKALVDKEKNKVVFVESGGDFVDVLFSFMTVPMGTIVALTNKEKSPTMTVGCMNKLYASIQSLDVKYFRTPKCRKMLLHPRNGTPINLKISVDDHIDSHAYSYWREPNNTLYRLGSKRKSCDFVKAGTFLKGLTRPVISDDLQLMHPTMSSNFSMLAELGVAGANSSALEVKEFHIGEDDVINLLTSSLLSKEALTQTLLKKNKTYKSNRGSFPSSSKRIFGLGDPENGKNIRVKIFVSKSKKRVCFAEVGEDFIDLVFSFLIIPLGHLLKKMQNLAIIDGCIGNVYKSVVNLDVELFNSGKEKEMLVNPKIAPKYGYDNQLIGVEEVNYDVYFDFAILYTGVKVEDPKVPTHEEAKSGGGYMAGPAMFIVMDDLSVIPTSIFSGLNILNKLDLPLNDIEERVVHVRNKEAVFLLVASFVSESALTDTFLKK